MYLVVKIEFMERVNGGIVYLVVKIEFMEG